MPAIILMKIEFKPNVSTTLCISTISVIAASLTLMMETRRSSKHLVFNRILKKEIVGEILSQYLLGMKALEGYR
jgi:hypothetical protein